MTTKKEIWETKQWTGGCYRYSTSEKCGNKIERDGILCYDPFDHITHKCRKELCPIKEK